MVCHNVGTAYAVYRAVELDQPLISRYVTIAGSVAHARNLEVLIGTPLGNLIEECGGPIASWWNPPCTTCHCPRATSTPCPASAAATAPGPVR